MSAAEQTIKSFFRYRFGSAEFDEVRFELRIEGLLVDVQRKPLEVLALLLANAGEVVTKEELLECVWTGRPTVESVISNAITKLRDALGDDNAAQLVTQSRVGYRLMGPVERIAVERALISQLALRQGDAVPLRPNFLLGSLINVSKSSEVWLARHVKTKEPRVYKFAPDGERLSSLKREVTLFRVLKESLGTRDDLVRILDWNFEAPPFFIECDYGGESLTEWAKGPELTSLSLQQRIDMFLHIADVVAAAHDVGVLHKDIKPANVLIARKPDSAAWQIRLTDFGSGRVLDPQRIQDLGITQLGLTMTAVLNKDDTGTLLYLAPELIAHQAPSIKSDIYALGMMLYQLLIGDLRKPLVSGWEREIEDELIREDIRAATEGDPAHRLSSVHVLTDRLRTLNARGQTLQQERRISESLRRAQVRRPWMIAAIVLLTTGLVVSSWQYLRATRAQTQTEQEAARAEAVTEFFNKDVLGAADPFSSEITQNLTMKAVMANAVNNINGKFLHDPATEATIRMMLGHIFVNMMDSAAAETQWRRAIALLTTASPLTQPQLLQSHYALAHTLSLQSKFDQAMAELVNADHLRSQYGIDDPETLVMTHRSWGAYFSARQQDFQAIPHFEQSLQLLLKQSPPNLSEIDNVRLALGESYIGVNRLKDAEQLSRQLLGDLKQRRDPSELTLALANRLYGESLLYQHRYQDAEPVIDQSYHATVTALGTNSSRTIDILNVRCNLYALTEQLEKALQCARQSYGSTRAVEGDQHLMTLNALANIGMAQYALNHYVEAARSLEPARNSLASIVGVNNSQTQGADYYLVRCLIRMHQASRAQLLMQPLDSKILEGSEPGAPWDMRLQLLHGMVLLAQGHRSEALPLLQPANQLHDDADPTDTILREARQALHSADIRNDDQRLAVDFDESHREVTH